MASILNRGWLALALIVLILASSSFDTTTIADARSGPDCGRADQSELEGCGSGGSSGSGAPSGPAPGSSKCKKGCCGSNKMGDCKCC